MAVFLQTPFCAANYSFAQRKRPINRYSSSSSSFFCRRLHATRRAFIRMRARTQEVAEATNDSVQQLEEAEGRVNVRGTRVSVFAIRETPTPERGKRAETRAAIVRRVACVIGGMLMKRLSLCCFQQIKSPSATLSHHAWKIVQLSVFESCDFFFFFSKLFCCSIRKLLPL